MTLVTLNEMKPALPVTSDGQRPLSLGSLPDLLFIAAEMGDAMMWAVSESAIEEYKGFVGFFFWFA